MKIRISFIASLFLLISVVSMGQDRSVKFEESNLAEALQKANVEGKILFVDFYTAWCGPCKMLVRDVFTKNEVADYMNKHFISLKIDCGKGEGLQLCSKYNITAYPTLLFFNPNGELRDKVIGAAYPDEFLQRIKKVVDKDNPFYLKESEYKSGNEDPRFLYDLFTEYKRMNDNGKATEVGQKLLSVIPENELFTPEMWTVVAYCYISDYGSKWWNFIIDNSARYEEIVGRENVAEKIGSTLHPYVFGYAIGKRVAKDRDELHSIKTIVDQYKPSQRDAIYSFLRMGESRSFNDFAKYFKTVQKEYRNGLPPSEHYRIMSNIFDYIYDNSNDNQRKNLKALLENSYNQQNEHLQKAYSKFFEAFEADKQSPNAVIN